MIHEPTLGRFCSCPAHRKRTGLHGFAVALLLLCILTGGCSYLPTRENYNMRHLWKHPGQVYHASRALHQPPPAVAPLGTISDAMWKSQEARAEASEFVVHQHEFELNTPNLNHCGKDHVTQLAARLCYNPNMPVIIERSLSSVKEGTEYQYPVHPNPELDRQRREVIVRSLAAMGVPDAEKRVLVAPRYSEGFTATEAQQVANQAFSGFGFGGGGFGGGLGGFGGGGFGFGGFGGGGFGF